MDEKQMASRYYETICCELCGEMLGFAPYHRLDYQCKDCNLKLPGEAHDDEEDET